MKKLDSLEPKKVETKANADGVKQGPESATESELSPEQLEEKLDTDVARFEARQQEEVERMDRDALSGSDSSLSSEELAEAKEEMGLVGKLQSLVDRVKEIPDRIRARNLDRKIQRVVKESGESDGGFNLNRQSFVDMLPTLSPEQIRRYPEIIAGTKLSLKRTLSSVDYVSADGWQIKRMDEIWELFQSQPEIRNEIFDDPEIRNLEDTLFLRCLLDPGTQHKAPMVRDRMHMDPERAKSIVLKTLRRTVNFEEDPELLYGGRVYNISESISGFQLGKEVAEQLFLERFQSYMKRDYPWGHAKNFRNEFNFSESEFKDLVSRNQEILEKEVYQRSLKLLEDHSEIDIVVRFFKHYNDELGFSLNLETLESMPEMQRSVEIAVLKAASNGTMLKNRDDLEYLSKVPLKDVLGNERGQEALYEGLQALIAIIKDEDIEYLKTYIGEFGFDLEAIKSDPRTLSSVRRMIAEQLKRLPMRFPTETIEFLGIKEEDIKDLKIQGVQRFITTGDFENAFTLLDTLSLEPAEEAKVSKDVFGVEDKFDFLLKIRKLYKETLPPVVFSSIIQQHERFSNKNPEQLEAYITISQKIVDSPSQEIQRLKDSLLQQLLETENPAESYQKIESIFIKNNLPTVGKVYKVFRELYPPDVFESKLQSSTSPILNVASMRRRYYLIYQDLLKTHIESANRSLRQYVEILLEGEDILREADENGIEALDDKKKTKLSYFFAKLNTLFVNSSLGTNETAPIQGDSSLEKKYARLKESLLVEEGQSVTERIGEMFLRPAGLNRLEDVLEKMREAKTGAHQRGLDLVSRAQGEKLELDEGDLLKGVNVEFISNILQNGSVSKEFLGASSDSDATPFDTDVSQVQNTDLEGGFQTATGQSLARGYGELLLAIKDRGQFQKTEKGSKTKPQSDKYELFRTGVLGEKHYGIRTGFPSTEIDFMVAKEGLASDSRELEKVFYEIAQNGYYIPVTDSNGKIIFTPEMYAKYRATFDGLDRYDGDSFEFTPTKSSDKNFEQVSEVVEKIDSNIEQVSILSNKIRSAVERVLDQSGIEMKPMYDTSILGAELLDIGSTGRYTNTPGDYDFDLTLKLDASDFSKAAEIAERIKSELDIEKDDSHSEASGYYQLRAKGVRSMGGEKFEKPIDIDIGFAKKSDLSVFGPHDAIQEKLDWIKKNVGEDAYKQAIANIIVAKKVLKEGSAYKRVEHGGFGGIGVENWILANNGNVLEAFRAFRDAAYENDNRVPFDEFKKKYKILDAGMNLKHLDHDNYIEKMRPEGYEAMLNAIEAYLGPNS